MQMQWVFHHFVIMLGVTQINAGTNSKVETIMKIRTSLKDQKEDIHKYVRIKGHIYEYWVIDVLFY